MGHCSRPWTTLFLQPRRAGPECPLHAAVPVPPGARGMRNLWNHPNMFRMRSSIAAGRSPDPCLACLECDAAKPLHEQLGCFAATDAQRRNLDRNREETVSDASELDALPLALSLDLSYACNFRCRYCGVRNASESIETALVAEAFSNWAPNLLYLHVSGGEPLVDRRFLQYLESPDRAPACLSITTNGSRLDESLLDRLLAFHRVELHISVDSFDPGTFRELRGGGELDPVLDAVQRAVRWRDRAVSSKGKGVWYVALNLVIGRLNVQEAPDFLRQAASVGVDGVDVCPLDGEPLDFDFIHHPVLLDGLDTCSLACEIRRAIEDLPSLEVRGFEPSLSALEQPNHLGRAM